VGTEFTPIPPPFPDRSGPTHNIGSASAVPNLAVVPLRMSRGRQYRRLLLADRSKPVSAGRGLPTLTLPAHPGTTPTDRRDQEASNYGHTRDTRSHPSCHPRCFLSLSEGWTLVHGSHKRPSSFYLRICRTTPHIFLSIVRHASISRVPELEPVS
jgi:hypothetical protein